MELVRRPHVGWGMKYHQKEMPITRWIFEYGSPLSEKWRCRFLILANGATFRRWRRI